VKAIVLHVVQGPDTGLSVTIPIGTYRVIGRGDFVTHGTAVQPHGEQRRLEREDQRLAADHLRRRASPGTLGARGEVAAFDRGEDIDVSDEAVSQTHSMVFLDEAGASVVDVASTNGTYVNGEKLTESALVPGDLLRIGETRIEIKAG
jgi:hypothetical protein